MTMKEAVEAYRDYVRITKTQGTIQFYAFYLQRIEHYFGDQAIDELEKKDIIRFIAHLKHINPKVKNATLNKYIITIKTIMKYTSNRTFDLKKLHEQKAIIPILKQTTIELIFDHLKRSRHDIYAFRNLVMFHLLLDTGLRINEVLHLKPSDLELATFTIHVRFTKTSHDRYVFFTETTKALLKDYLDRHSPVDYLFYDFTTGKPLVTSSIESLVHRLKTRLLIKESISPHKWRHTFATHYLTQGGSLESLRMLLGHHHLNTTQKYLHVSKEALAKEYHFIYHNSLKESND